MIDRLNAPYLTIAILGIVPSLWNLYSAIQDYLFVRGAHLRRRLALASLLSSALLLICQIGHIDIAMSGLFAFRNLLVCLGLMAIALVNTWLRVKSRGGVY